MPEKPASPLDQMTPRVMLFLVISSTLTPVLLLVAAFKELKALGWLEWPAWVSWAILAGVAAVAWQFLSWPMLQELRRRRSVAPGTGPAPAPEPGAASVTPRDEGSLPAVGLAFLVMVVVLLTVDFLPQWWANRSYAEGRCVLLDKRVYEAPKRGGTYRPEFLIRYTADGREYEAWAYTAVRSTSAWRWPKERFLERFTVGEEYPCWYDPADPSRVMFVRDYSWLSYGLLAAVVVLALLLGTGVLRRLGEAGRAAEEAGGLRPGPNPAGICTAPRRLGTPASVNVTAAVAAAGPGVRRPSVGVTPATAGNRPGPPPDATRRLLGRLAAPLIHTLPFGLIAGAVWTWPSGGVVWYGMGVGGLIGLAAGLVFGTADWLRNGR